MSKPNKRNCDRSEYLKDADAAAFLNLSVFTLRNWRNTGIGPRFRKFERSVRYALVDLREYADRAVEKR